MTAKNAATLVTGTIEKSLTGVNQWYIRHSLGEERVSPGFTDDQISPLYNHNTDEKGSVTGVLQDFTLIVSLQEKVRK